MPDGLRSRITYANVASTLAVFLAFGGGTAIALNGVNTVRSDDIAPGAVHASDISKSVGIIAPEMDGGAITDPKAPAVDGGGFQNIDSQRFKGSRGSALAIGTVTVENPVDGGGELIAEARIKHVGHTHPGIFTTSIPEGASATVPVLLLCNGIPAGTQTVRLQVRVTGDNAVVHDNSVDVVSFRAIPNPP